MKVRAALAALIMLFCGAGAAVAQGAIPCDVNPGCDAGAQPKPFQFRFEIRPAIRKVVKQAVVRPTPAAKPLAVTKKPAVKAKPAALVKKPVKRKPALNAAVSPTPGPSWAGLVEMPVPVLEGDDFADIGGQYIVDLDPAAFAAAGLDLLTISIPELATQLGVRPEQIDSVQRRFLLSVVLRATPEQAAAMTRNRLVRTVHPDTKIKAAGGGRTEKRPLSWGLDRLDVPTLPLDGQFDRETGDYQARLYLLDTGVDRNNKEFDGRVIWGARFAKPIPDTSGHCRDHGTEMASLAAGALTGSAPKAEVVDVVVLPCSRQMTGAASSLIKAAEWLLIREADHGDGKPVIVNMSLAGKWSRKINEAVSIMTKNGLAVVVAAGNNSDDACRYSPASARAAVTVAATGPKDEMPGFSNYGPCVDVNAPGKLLTTVSEGAGDNYVVSSGTSGAAALVSGLLARSVKAKGSDAAVSWIADAAVPAAYWRKGSVPRDGAEMLLAQARPLWRKLCRAASGGLMLRDRPGPAGRRLGLLAAGAAVEVQEAVNGWARVGWEGKKGWLDLRNGGQPVLSGFGGEPACAALQ